jgi:elongation factor Ts
MKKDTVKMIKKLREETGAGVVEAKKALEAVGNDFDKAKKELMKKVAKKAAKRADREVKDGLVHSYIHAGGKAGSIVLIGCETDFVAKTEEFKKLCQEVAMQVCTDDYKNVEELIEAEYIRDADKKVKDLVQEVIAKTGENVEIVDFKRLNV